MEFETGSIRGTSANPLGDFFCDFFNSDFSLKTAFHSNEGGVESRKAELINSTPLPEGLFFEYLTGLTESTRSCRRNGPGSVPSHRCSRRTCKRNSDRS
ncbi:hypothetical protein TNCV_4091001 [Trichonephila clavipes]|nr:hypothetical protein TNCV_4091001 [Trichonephila clavipes]